MTITPESTGITWLAKTGKKPAIQAWCTSQTVVAAASVPFRAPCCRREQDRRAPALHLADSLDGGTVARRKDASDSRPLLEEMMHYAVPATMIGTGSAAFGTRLDQSGVSQGPRRRF